MITFAAASVNCCDRQRSTWPCIGSKLRCIRSTPTDKLSWSEKFLECLANTGVKSPLTRKFSSDQHADANGDRQPE
jgi:hypothetical protein